MKHTKKMALVMNLDNFVSLTGVGAKSAKTTEAVPDGKVPCTDLLQAREIAGKLDVLLQASSDAPLVVEDVE